MQESPKQLLPLPRALPLLNSTWKAMTVSYWTLFCVFEVFLSNWSALQFQLSMMLFTHTTTDPRRRPSVIVCVRKQHLAFTKWWHLMLTTITWDLLTNSPRKMKFKGTFRRMSPQQMSTMVRASVTPLVKFKQTKEITVTYIKLDTIWILFRTCRTHKREVLTS